MTDRFRESSLYRPLAEWLKADGWTVHVEIFDCDVVAVRDGQCWAIELKQYVTGDLHQQLRSRVVWADFISAAVAVPPRITTGLRYSGFGLFVVSGDRVRQRICPRPQPWHRHRAHAYRMKRLANRQPAQEHEVAGLPACRQLKEQRRRRDGGAKKHGGLS